MPKPLDSNTYPGFDGRVSKTLADSVASWEKAPRPPAEAPNVVVMLCDDLGFSDIGCYGSEISTPNLDRLAARGTRFVNFHVTPLCSPTRAALLTGVNSHAAGVGYVTNLGDVGFPGNRGELAEDVLCAAEIFRANGYATLMSGKWHLSRAVNMSEGAPKSSWPLQHGFDRFYGFLEEGFTDFHNPNQLIEDNHVLDVDVYPDGYYLTDDLTTKAVEMVRASKLAESDRPVFLYFAHGAVHAPIHAKAEDMARYRGAYDEGWDEIRARRFARQKELGVIEADTELPGRNSEPELEVSPWADYSTQEQAVFARHMEAYAAMVDNIDQNLGRLLDAFEQLGELDNTIVIFTSDNGASKEGCERGTTEYLRTQAAYPRNIDTFDRDVQRLDWIGGPRAQTHYPRGWAMASNTPFRLYKSNTFAGGHQVPFVMAWPGGPAGCSGIRSQYTFVTDVLPSLIDIIGLKVPEHRQGAKAKPMTGASFLPALLDVAVQTQHPKQYYEVLGHRGYYSHGWEIVARRIAPDFPDSEWQLFHTEQDPTQIEDLATAHPERLAELIAGWEDAAWANQVYPLGGGAPSPELDPLYERPITLTPEHKTLERFRSSLLIADRDFIIDVDLDHRQGDEGVLVAHGGQAGGYLLYIEDDALVFALNEFGDVRTLDGGRLATEVRNIRVEARAPGGGVWNLRLLVDGAVVAKRDGQVQTFAPMCPFEGIDVGIDRRSPVLWDLRERRGAFRYSGKLRSVTYRPGEFAPDARRRQAVAAREALTRFD